MEPRPESDGHAGQRTRPEADALPASTEEWEQLRRSVAMLSPGAWALRRDVAMAALGLLIGHLRQAEAARE